MFSVSFRLFLVAQNCIGSFKLFYVLQFVFGRVGASSCIGSLSVRYVDSYVCKVHVVPGCCKSFTLFFVVSGCSMFIRVINVVFPFLFQVVKQCFHVVRRSSGCFDHFRS